MQNKKNIKLFLVSGKARSGKGEVSNIIKNYYSDLKCITLSFGHYIKEYAKNVSDWDGSEDTKPRTLLQNIGIKLVREKIDPNLFIRRIIEDIEVYSYFYDVIIINDVRLKEELKALKEKYPNSISFRIERKDYTNNLTPEENNHITETDLDSVSDFDFIIDNNNDYENLISNVNTCLRSVD